MEAWDPEPLEEVYDFETTFTCGNCHRTMDKLDDQRHRCPGCKMIHKDQHSWR